MVIRKKADWWNDAVSYLSDTDEIMKNIINKHKDDYIKSRGEPFNALWTTNIC